MLDDSATKPLGDDFLGEIHGLISNDPTSASSRPDSLAIVSA
ncbi:MAG: hypothetical protein N2C14_26465 [Planctomycetales bacterium]